MICIKKQYALIFYYDYEEFIKKCITSIENYFIQHKIKKTSFKETLKKVLEPTGNIYGNETIYKNICYLYDVRNKIVHNTLRIDYDIKEWKVLCHTALATVQYLFQRICNNKDEGKHIFNLYVYYCIIKGSTDTLLCNILERGNAESTNEKSNKSSDEEPNKSFDEKMYDSLIISDEIKSAIG